MLVRDHRISSWVCYDKGQLGDFPSSLFLDECLRGSPATTVEAGGRLNGMGRREAEPVSRLQGRGGFPSYPAGSV